MLDPKSISIDGLRKQFGRTFVLDSITMDISGGEFVSLLGPSGSGKTTLLMTIAGFSRPNAGSIRFGSREIVNLPPHKRNIGMVFQNYALFPHMTVAENVAYPLRVRGVSKIEQSERVRRTLEMVDLGKLLNRRPDQLSGGQRQRVAFARAMVFEPDVMLMDEPLSALDKNLRETMQVEIRQLHARLGMTVVYVTHDQREALTISDRVAVLRQGRIEQIGTPQELYDSPGSRFVADFVGETSFLPISVKDGLAEFNGQPVQVAGPVLKNNCQALLVVRPEKLAVLSGPPEGLNVISGRVSDVVYQGDSVRIHVVLADGSTLVVRQPSRQDIMNSLPGVGGPIQLGMHPKDTIIVKPT